MSSARLISASDLLLPCRPRLSPSMPARAATASSPPEHVSSRRPSSATQAGYGRAQEGLAGVVDVHSPADVGKRGVEGILEGTCAGPEVGLAHHKQRRAELFLELADGDAVDGELTGVVLPHILRPTWARGARSGPRERTSHSGASGERVVLSLLILCQWFTSVPARKRPAGPVRWPAPGWWRRSATGGCG